MTVFLSTLVPGLARAQRAGTGSWAVETLLTVPASDNHQLLQTRRASVRCGSTGRE